MRRARQIGLINNFPFLGISHDPLEEGKKGLPLIQHILAFHEGQQVADSLDELYGRLTENIKSGRTTPTSPGIIPNVKIW